METHYGDTFYAAFVRFVVVWCYRDEGLLNGLLEGGEDPA